MKTLGFITWYFSLLNRLGSLTSPICTWTIVSHTRLFSSSREIGLSCSQFTSRQGTLWNVVVMSTVRDDISITSILYNIRYIKDVAIISSIATLRLSKRHCTIRCWCIVSMSLFLTFNFVLRTNVVRMCHILKVNIILTIHLDNVTTFDFVDNISVFKLIIDIFHQKFFTDDSVIRNLAIIVMIMISMRSHITLISDLDDDLFCVDSLSLTDFIWCQVLCFLTSLITIYISYSIRIFLNLTSLVTTKLIGTNT